MIEDDLSRIDECVTRSMHKLDSGYEWCEDKGKISTKFVPSSTYKDEKKNIKGQTNFIPNPAQRSLDIPLTAINSFTGRREKEEPTHKKLQSKA
jgi:hypothetical protein